MSNRELVTLSSVELRRRIGTKEISPVELLEACLARIEEINPAINAVTAMCVARARKAAEVLRQRVAMRQLPVHLRIDLIGLASVHDGDDGKLWQASNAMPQDVRVRLAASSALQDDADQAAREVLALYCCGPAGGGGVRWPLPRPLAPPGWRSPSRS